MPRRKKRAAWGSLVEVERNVWRLRYWANGPDGYRRRSATIRGTRKQAEQKRSELMLAHSEDAPCPTVGEVWEQWALPDFERRVADGDMAENSLMMYRSTWRRYVEPIWSTTPCDAVRPLAIQQWLSQLSLTQAQRSIQLMRSALDYAVRYELIGHNPARERYLMPSKSTIERRDDGIWTLPELRDAWQAVRGEWFEPAFLLAGFGGLRVGEALGVMASDVDAANVDGVQIAAVKVVRQIPNNGIEPARLKTAQSERTAILAGSAAERLLVLSDDADGYLSGDGMGCASSQRRLLNAWERAQLPVRHPFRNLRNSWQTWMRWTMRMEPWAIETLMGHKFAGVTGQHYDRPTREVLARMVADAYRERPYDAGWNWTS